MMLLKVQKTSRFKCISFQSLKPTMSEQEVQMSDTNNVEAGDEEVIELDSDLLQFVGQILSDTQKSVSNHLKHLREIAVKFEGQPRSLVAHLEPFIDAVLLRFKKDANVERVIDFFVKIATYNDSGQEWIDTITTQLIEYCLSKENAKNKAVRFRVCDIIGKLLKNMAETYELEFCSLDFMSFFAFFLFSGFPSANHNAKSATPFAKRPNSDSPNYRMTLVFDMPSNAQRGFVAEIGDGIAETFNG